MSVRAQREQFLKPEVALVLAENFAVYSVRKVWRQMMREGFPVARCAIERLMNHSRSQRLQTYNLWLMAERIGGKAGRSIALSPPSKQE